MKEEEIVSIIKEKYGKVSAELIAKECGVDVFKIYRLARKNNIKTNKTRNKTVGELSYIQKQILISGIFGDGSYRKNGNVGFQYRECHALGESDYCNWKRLQLGKLTDGYAFGYSIRKNGKNEVLSFETMTTKDLEFYAELNKDKFKAVNYLDKVGFCLFILDDGWRLHETSYIKGNLSFMLTIYQYEENIRNEIIKRFKELFGEDSCKENGIKRIDLKINKNTSMEIAEIILDLLGSEMDIVKKKLFANKQEKTYEDIKHLLISNKLKIPKTTP